MTENLFNPTLRDYLKAAATPDWFPALSELIRNTLVGTLTDLKKETEAELNKFGYFCAGSQTHFVHIYLSRIRSLCRRELETSRQNDDIVIK